MSEIIKDQERNITETRKLNEYFGENVFNDNTMRERLPKAIYKSLRKTIEGFQPLQSDVAEVVANAMKDWAIEKGATHFSHWFQPMTGITAEKHDAFISPTPDGRVIMEFSGKELIKGEPDASSFPSGGLRVTFEARGYTAWDCTSPAFFRDNTLYIPTAFYSYTGDVLDKKTPLLRSMDALSTQALRVLKLFGNTTSNRVNTTVGAEQEYFLITKENFRKRPDLVYTGRTVFGAPPPKGQELDDHYFGTIKERVMSFMSELDIELWKLGVSSKTKHNEVAPAQHELAPIFTTSNIATDHNQLIMDTLKKVAERHGLVCLLHEKPFAGVNGSGKHNNWSMSTNDGENLLEPSETPHENLQFLFFLAAVIKAVDEYAELIRATAANPGNDHRLGANEAPPAIISIFVGEQLNEILEQIEKSGSVSKVTENTEIKDLIAILPSLPKDATDRNRTSPFAFTGNKFEFRMVPSSASIAGPNFVLNTVVAEALLQIGDELAKEDNVDDGAFKIIQNVLKKHKRVIFNGNNYADEWVAEAEKRGLSNLKSTVDAMGVMMDSSTISVMEKHGVLKETELESRLEIILENYAKTIRIEALTMISICRTQIIPTVIDFAKGISDAVISAKAAGADDSVQSSLLNDLTENLKQADANTSKLEKAVAKGDADEENQPILASATYYKDVVFPIMDELRSHVDSLEKIVDTEKWPLPSYGEMMYNI
ncbi:MAG: glutamine synthetase III [Leptospirales bacterium]